VLFRIDRGGGGDDGDGDYDGGGSGYDGGGGDYDGGGGDYDGGGGDYDGGGSDMLVVVVVVVRWTSARRTYVLKEKASCASAVFIVHS
jgi:hypothetical protein